MGRSSRSFLYHHFLLIRMLSIKHISQAVFFLFLVVISPLAATAQNKELVIAQDNSTRSTQYGKFVNKRNKLTVKVISGGINSTYLQMASDMANVLDGQEGQETMRVVPVIGKGGEQNVMDILYLKGIDMGLVQQGQLTSLQEKNPKLYANIKSRIHFITKLYNAEFHLIAPREINSIKELEGKKVAFGKELGATDVTVRTIFKKIGINVERIYGDFASTIEQMRNGEISAVAVLGGAPIQGINDIALGQEFHFLPLHPDAVGLKGYFNLVDDFLPTKITAKHYPGMVRQDQPVASLASGVVLMVYNWGPKTERYKKLEVFINRFFKRFDEFLLPSRHSKWREVSIHAKVPGWTRFKPAKEWLDQRRQEIGQEVSSGEMKIAMDVFVRQYTKIWKVEQITPLQRDDIWSGMYRVFGRWWTVDLER